MLAVSIVLQYSYFNIVLPIIQFRFIYLYFFVPHSGADPGFGVRGDEIRQGDLRVILLLSHMFMERMMQEN